MLTVQLRESNNYTGQRLEKLRQVFALIERVMNSDAFKAAVLGFETAGKKSFYFRTNVFGRPVDIPHTNEEVYAILMAGIEDPGNAGDDSMDVYATLLNGSDGNVIGYGNPGTREIFTYSVMFDSMNAAELANHFVHEWCHKLGFGHAYLRNRWRNYSVPYAVGDIVEELAEKEMPQQMEAAAAGTMKAAGSVTVSVDFNNMGGQVTVIHMRNGVLLQAVVLTPANNSHSFTGVISGDRMVVNPVLVKTASLSISSATLPGTPYTLSNIQPRTFMII